MSVAAKKREGVGSFDAFVPALAQVYILIIFGFSGDFVVVVVAGVFFPLGVSTSILQINKCCNQSRGYLKSSCVCFLKSSIAEGKFAPCRKKSCPILSSTAIKKASGEKDLHKTLPSLL